MVNRAWTSLEKLKVIISQFFVSYVKLSLKGFMRTSRSNNVKTSLEEIDELRRFKADI